MPSVAAVVIASIASDVAILIAATAGFITSAGGVYVAVRTLHVSERNLDVANQVHTQVKTMNGLTAAELLDAEETRRVDAIPVEDRTKGEQEHIDAEPLPDRP